MTFEGCTNSRCYMRQTCERWQARKTAERTRMFPQSGAFCSFRKEIKNDIARIFHEKAGDDGR